MWGFCICGRDKSVPYSCEQIAITLRTDCDNAWRTFREIHTLNHEIHNGHSVRRRGRFIVPVYICYHFCGWLSSFCGGLFIVCGGFCICGRDKSVPYSCEQIAITLLTDWNNACRTGRKLSTFAHEIRCEHTVRRRGRFIVPVYICYQFCGWL